MPVVLNGVANVRPDRRRVPVDGVSDVALARNVQLFKSFFSFALGVDNNLTHMIIGDRMQGIAHYWLDVFALLRLDDDLKAIHFLVALSSPTDQILHSVEEGVSRLNLDDRLADKVHPHHLRLGALPS